MRIHFFFFSPSVSSFSIPSATLPKTLSQLERKTLHSQFSGPLGGLTCPLLVPWASLSSNFFFPDQGSPFAQEVLEDGRQASPYYGGSYGPGAPSPGSSDVSTAGKSPVLALVSLLQTPQNASGTREPSTRICRPYLVRLAPVLKLTSPPPGTATPQSSHSSDSGGSDLDLDLTDSKVFPRGELRAGLGGPVPQRPSPPFHPPLLCCGSHSKASQGRPALTFC